MAVWSRRDGGVFHGELFDIVSRFDIVFGAFKEPMKKSSPANIVQTSLLGVIALLSVLVVIQLNAFEKRLVAQQQQIRALGESTERVASQLKTLKASGVPSRAGGDGAQDCPIDEVLHPDVPNFLAPKGLHWPSEGANLDGKLVRGWPSGDPKSLNPLTQNSAEVSALVQNLVDSAVARRNRWTDPDQWYGDLACRVEVTDDYKTYTIYLRKGAKWQQPGVLDLTDKRYQWLAGDHEVTAHDFVFTLDMMLNPQVENGALKNYYKDLESWKALSDHVLEVRWKKKLYSSVTATLSLGPLPEFLFAFDESGKRIPKETVGMRFNQHWFAHKGYVGSGPYRMVEYTPGSRIVLLRNEDFHGEKPAIKELVYPIYTDPDQTLLRLKADELTLGLLRPNQYRQEVLSWNDKPKAEWPKNSPFLNGKIFCKEYERPAYSYLGWNTDNALFTDARVRTAMTLALNRQEIIDKVFVGLGKVTNGPFLPETGGLDPSVEVLPFDLVRAGKLLDEAGWKDTDGDGLRDKMIEGKKKPFEFTLLIYANAPEYTAMANIFKEDLLKVGVKLDISAAEWSLMQKRMEEKRFEAFTGAWALNWETDPFQIWHSSQADIPKGSNMVGFRNPQADELIERLRETFDPEERKKMLREIHKLIHAAQPCSFLMIRKGVICYQNTVEHAILAKARPVVDTIPWSVKSTN